MPLGTPELKLVTTNCFGKIVKRILNRRPVDTTDKYGRIDERQFAFQQGKGCGTYMASMAETIEEAF